MQDSASNVTLNSSVVETCTSRSSNMSFGSLIDLLTFAVGQPVTARLLWIAVTSKKSTDILNCNLALFNNFLYLVCIFNFVFVISLPQSERDIQMLLLIYAQTGGPMGLSFICLERYVAVIHPTSYPLLRKYRCREAGAATVWLCSTSIAVATVLTKDDASSLTETVIKSIPLSVMLLMTVLMLCCSICIIRALQRSGPGQEKLHPVKKKAFIVVRATSAINLVFYIPVTMMQKFRFLDECAFVSIITPVCIVLLCAASVVHPLFYLSTQRRLLTCSRRPQRAP